MKYFPVFLDGSKINAVVIGGGDVAARKIELLLKSTTKITVVSDSFSPGVQRLIDSHQLSQLNQPYRQGLLDDKNLAIAATDNSEVNAAVYEEASRLGILVNVVDQPELCTYITPAIIDRSPMIIALSSSGSAPILVRMLREQIEKVLPHAYGRLADFSLKFRDHVKARVKGLRNRRTFWEKTLKGRIGQAILDGNTAQAEQQLIASLNQEIAAPSGEIVFIHTQDGNPDHLTLSAHREMQYADAVFYDEAVNPELIEYIRRDADKYPQQISSTILINYQHAMELATQGQKVIYLLAEYHPLPENAALSLSHINKKTLICGG
ncbi:NAD(P)-dependent oxidoreductase [Thalassomonas actiniarum]|uniref:precorrin-2 dehydrogenase n=1 Tax=Thalassomonas actiniarum TaxID=485447 RepID=A0AAF0C4E1_9GAMM|nr:NAD(P)-dependent oxidoreductase [Thalassomonas actiniarum]WDD99729.1 siroheme synthase [Thalassomonas actiniarum]